MVVQIRVDCGYVSTTTHMHVPTYVDTYLQYTHMYTSIKIFELLMYIPTEVIVHVIFPIQCVWHLQ